MNITKEQRFTAILTLITLLLAFVVSGAVSAWVTNAIIAGELQSLPKYKATIGERIGRLERDISRDDETQLDNAMSISRAFNELRHLREVVRHTTLQAQDEDK